MKISVVEWSLFYVDEEFLKDMINTASLSYDRSREYYEAKIAKEVESQLVKVNSYFKQLLCDLSTKLESFKINLNSRVCITFHFTILRFFVTNLLMIFLVDNR